MTGFAPDPRFDSPEARAGLLLEHQAGASVRVLAAKYSRSKSAVARDLATAKTEAEQEAAEAPEREHQRVLDVTEQHAREERARLTNAPVTVYEPERLGQVWTAPGPAEADRKLRDVRGTDVSLHPSRPLSRKLASGTGEAAFLERNDIRRLERRANLNRGLGPEGQLAVALLDFDGKVVESSIVFPDDVERKSKLLGIPAERLRAAFHDPAEAARLAAGVPPIERTE